MSKIEPETLNYSNYLQLEDLLKLQKLRSPTNVHDELLFIIIHQVYELWFKQILHELSALKLDLLNNELHKIMLCLKRVRHVLKVLVLQIDILETMGPLSFLSFREHLRQSSGFQSIQFREIEFLLGLKNEKFLNNTLLRLPERERLLTRFKEPSIWEDILNFFKNNININNPYSLYCEAEELTEQHHLLIYIYKNPSVYTEIAELIVDIDEGLQEWRYRHVKIVERTIGDGKLGTGGSSGVNYLKKTLFTSFCPELWHIRNYL